MFLCLVLHFQFCCKSLYFKVKIPEAFVCHLVDKIFKRPFRHMLLKVTEATGTFLFVFVTDMEKCKEQSVFGSFSCTHIQTVP